MQVIKPELIKDKKVLLRADIDIPIEKGKVTEDFRLKAGLPTLKLCLDNAGQVIMMGHIGRPSFAEATEGKPDKFFVPKYSIAPVIKWFKNHGYQGDLNSGKLMILENLRFDPREESLDESFARELTSKGDVFVNEAFAAYRPAVSTTVLPKLLPHEAGLRFAKEVEKLTEVRNNPKKPLVVIMGGTKVKDKLPVIKILAGKADAVLVGGKLISEIHEQNLSLPANVLVGRLTEDGFDITSETTASWKDLIMKAKMIVWNGPVGKFEDPKNDQSAKVAQMVLESGAQIIVGGGDTISLLGGLGLLGTYEEKGFVSTGGGAMLKFLTDGTLPIIRALS